MSVTDKYSKRLLVVPGRDTWSAEDWARALLKSLNVAGWGIPLAIILDRDRKFTGGLWKELFRLLGTRFLWERRITPKVTVSLSEATKRSRLY